MSLLRKKGRRILIAVICLIVVLAGAYVLRDKIVVGDTAGAADSTATDSTAVAEDEEKDEGPAPVPVEVAMVERREMSSFYVTTATLEPEKKVDILAKIGGQVYEIIAEEGAFVKKGDLLARLDDREQKIALEQERINRDQQKREVERLQSMHEQDLISDKEFDDIKFQYELAKNKYESALLGYEWTRIRAPFDGVVTERAVDAGEHINIGTKLFVMADTTPLQLTMYLPEVELKSIEVGQVVEITPDINPDMKFTGEVIRVAPEVDQRTGTVKVTAVSRGGGFPGSFVRVKIITDTRDGTMAVPRRSVVADAGDRYVFVAEADTVRRIKVEVGYEDESFSEILAGIADTDTVVTAGVGAIREGTKIKVIGQDEDTVTEAANN
jgi:RND family efflux transporter MFP subunit